MLEVNPIHAGTGRRLSWPLYQWDKSRSVEIRGLSLPTTPEIHFTSVTMSRAIVQPATMNTTGVIVTKVPNSLLQKPYNITAFVCIRDGDAFKTLAKFEIPVKARPQPAEYTFEYDDEVYSYENLEKRVNSAYQDYYNAKIAYMSAESEANAWKDAAQESMQNYNKAVNELRKTEQAFAQVTAMELLWENPTPDSAFAEGYLPMDTTGYAALLLMRTRKQTPAAGVYNEFLVADPSILQKYGFYCGGYYYARNVRVNPNNVWVSVCNMEDDEGSYKKDDAGNIVTVPECCVPVRIYGLRHWPKE